MTYTHLNNDYESYRLERTPSYAPTPGYLDREYTPSVICPSPDQEDLLDQRSTSCRHQSGPAVINPLVRCDYDNAWDEQSPGCIHYQIEWKAKLNNRVVVKDTKQDLTLPPSSYWEDIKKEANNILRRKIARSRRVRLDDTNMVLSVKSQRDIDKRFEGTAVDWQIVEKQLLAWAYLFRLGKKIRLQISINYIDDSGPPSSTDKRGKSSTTRRMLSNRDIQIDAEQTSGHDPVWRDIYRIMRCPGPPCRHEGQYCWQDPEGKRHHRLNTHHLKALIKYVEQGGVLEDHDDVPDSFREQLYAEEEQRREKQKKDQDNTKTGSSSPPTIINNFLSTVSTGSSQLSTPHSCANEVSPVTSRNAEPVVIHGLLDIAVDEYTEWQLSRVQNQTFRDNIRRAREVTLEYCLDLSQIHEDQNPEFFVQHEVKLGAARRFVRDIHLWVKQRGEATSYDKNSDLN